jgi:hypothetical protein
LPVGAVEGQELSAAFGGYDLRGLKESDKLVPGQFCVRGHNVDEIES